MAARRLVIENSHGWIYRPIGAAVAVFFAACAWLGVPVGWASALLPVRHRASDAMVGALGFWLYGTVPCAIVVLFGLWWALGRRATVVNPRRRVVTSWAGLLVPMVWRSWPFDRVAWVAVQPDYMNPSRTWYDIRIEVRRSKRRGILVRGGIESRRDAFALAREIAETIGVPTRTWH